MKKICTQVWKYFAGGATVLAYGAWFDRMKTPERNLEYRKELNSQLDSIPKEVSEVRERLSSTLDEGTKVEISNKTQEIINGLGDLKGINSKYQTRFEEGSISSDSETSYNLYNSYKEDVNSTVTKVANKAQEIEDIISSSKGKFMGENPISNLITEFNEYLASLSAMEICLVINITSCLFIFTCIISILFAISGNYLIDKFSLEQKLPKLSKIIQLRVKFQYYYIIINSVFIILAILPLIIVNTITLING